MASLSNFHDFSGSGGQQSYGNLDNLTLSECTCPICMYIFIEPVTMPCTHTLCMVCFQQNVAEANLSCPLCRRRISTWARRSTKLNKLVDEKMWRAIKKAFPQKVTNRLDGVDDDDDSEEDIFIHVPNIAAPGEIKEEYEREMQKVEDEREQVRLGEEVASRALIEQLQEEEAERNREQEALIQQDEELVRKLVSDDKLAFPASIQRTPKSTMLDRFVTRGRERAAASSNIPPVSTSTRLGPTPLPDVSSTTNEVSPSVLSHSSLPSATQTRASSVLSGSSVIVVEDSNTSMLSADLNISPGASTSRSVSVNPSESSLDSFNNQQFGEPAQPWQQQKPQRAGSADSMSLELCHFKPIHSSPRTPPRHRVGGGVFADPPVIRSTPRNLSQLQRESGSWDEEETGLTIPDGSPVMRHRLSQLAEERKEKVAALSKSIGPDLPLLPSVIRHGFSSPDKTKSSPPDTNDQVNPSPHIRTLSFAGSPGSAFGFTGDGLTGHQLILPLESNFDDSESSDADVPKPFRFVTRDHRLKLKSRKKSSSSISPENGFDVCRRLSPQHKKDQDKNSRSPQRNGESAFSSRSRILAAKTTHSLPDHKRKVLDSNSGDETQVRLHPVSEQTERDDARSGSKDDARGGTCSASLSDCAMDVRVTSTLLTPNTLADRKEKVLRGAYTDETPLVLQARKRHSGEKKSYASPASPVVGSLQKCLKTVAASLGGSQVTSGDVKCSAQIGVGVRSKMLDVVSSELEQTSVVNCSEVGSPLPKKIAQVKPRQLLRREADDSDGDSTGVRLPIAAKTAEECVDMRQLRANRSPTKQMQPHKNTTSMKKEIGEVSPRRKLPPQKHVIPTKKCSPHKQVTPTRRSERMRKVASISDGRCLEDNPQKASHEKKPQQRISSENGEGLSKDAEGMEMAQMINKPGLKRVRSTEDKENEGSQTDCSPENPSKRSCTNSNVDVEVDDCSGDEAFPSPKKSTQQTHFSIEYSPEVGGKRLKKFPKSRLSTKSKTKQAKLCFVTTTSSGAAGSSSGVSNKLVFSSNPTFVSTSSCSTSCHSPKGKSTSTSTITSDKKSPPKRCNHHWQHSEHDTSDDDSITNDNALEAAPTGPVFLDRSHFHSDFEYKQHLEEQDRLLALQLQADFDLEHKLRLTAIRRKGSDGQYLLRRKASTCSTTSSRSTQPSVRSKHSK